MFARSIVAVVVGRERFVRPVDGDGRGASVPERGGVSVLREEERPGKTIQDGPFVCVCVVHGTTHEMCTPLLEEKYGRLKGRP